MVNGESHAGSALDSNMHARRLFPRRGSGLASAWRYHGIVDVQDNPTNFDRGQCCRLPGGASPTCQNVRLISSVADLAEISLRLPRKLFIFTIKRLFIGSKHPKIK